MKITTFSFIPSPNIPICWCGNSFPHTHEEDSKLHVPLERIKFSNYFELCDVVAVIGKE